MKASKKKKLEAAGWKVGSTQQFLELSDVEADLLNMRVALANAIKEQRKARKLSQAVLADRIGSSQSRVAKMEAGDPSVSIDLMVKSLLRTGSTRAEIGRAIAHSSPPK